MNSLSLADQVRSYINRQIHSKIPTIQIANQFREPVLPQQFAKFNESEVRRMAQLIVSEIIRGTHSAITKKNPQQNVQIGGADIDSSLFGVGIGGPNMPL